MDPATMFAAAAVVQAIGSIQQGNASAANYKMQAQAADYNAALSRQQGEGALQESTAAQIAHQRKFRQFAGLQRAGVVESGTGYGGSNADIVERSATLAELDQLTLAYQGTMRARAFNAQGQLDEFGGRILRANARSARTSGYLNGAASMVQGMGLYSAKAAPSKGAASVFGPNPSSFWELT